MGNNWSSLEEEPPVDPWWPSVQTQPGSSQCARNEENAEVPRKGKVKEEELETFKQELARKRALRHEALSVLQAELKDLRSRVEEERTLRQKAEEEKDRLRNSTEEVLQRELEKEKEEKSQLLEERKLLMEEVEEKVGLERQVQALKDVSQIGKEMLRIRELQVKELRKKLVEINISSVVAPPEDLRLEYEKQIENIRKLRSLYEERAAATLLEHRRELEREEAKIAVLETKMSDMQKAIEDHKESKKDMEDKIEKLESAIQKTEDELEKTKDELFSSTAQNSSLNSQMTLINKLFSHMLVSPEVDFDRLTRLLNEHHGLIADMTVTGDTNEVAALLVDLAEQMDKEKESDRREDKRIEVINNELQSEIASNLSKVWRVMIELLSHHQAPTLTEPAGGADSCYKNIQTPSGPRSVISVSQTFMTLKDLILEKNKLVKEVGRLKTLNHHLEHRLGSQEKRLSVVTTELRKTWAVVNKLKAQHKQLHTHEKILRYELQQKRCMLTELKGELENCRENWEKARQKNSQTEEDWKQLRKEFAARKSRKESNSAESGYEEDDVQSPPSEPNKYGRSSYELTSNGINEPELSEEDIEHSDGNSFDTVVDLLEIDCLENQQDIQSDVPYVLCDVSSQALEITHNLLPLTGSEFTEGLDQIESEDLAAVLDIQYQTQLLGADYNLSLPSSSGSSPIPTENDDFTSSEVDISEEDVSSNDNHIYSSPLPSGNNSVSEDILLFGSNSSKNISRFLDGLFIDQNLNPPKNLPSNVVLNDPSTSKTGTETVAQNVPTYKKGECYSSDDLTPTVGEDNQYIFPRTCHSNVCEEISELGKVSENETITAIPLHSESEHIVENEDVYEEPINKPVNAASSPESRTHDELLKAREDRLKRLEIQCRSLVNKVTSTSFRSEIISNKLDELHLEYGPVENDVNKKSGMGGEGICQDNKMSSDYENNANSEVSLSTLHLKNVSSNEEEKEGTISLTDNTVKNKTESSSLRKTSHEEIDIRTEKLKRLEDQCKTLFSKISSISPKNDTLSDKRENPYSPNIALSEHQNKPDIHSTACGNFTSGKAPETCQILNINKTKCNLRSKENKESKPPDLASESKNILNQCSLAGPSIDSVERVNVSANSGRTPEQILDARAERFKRLEEQCKSLLSKMTATSLRSEIISNKLDELHSCYGSSEDASDNEEHSLLSKSPEKKIVPSPSRRSNKRPVLAEGDNHTQNNTSQNTIPMTSDKCNSIEHTCAMSASCTDNNSGSTNLISRISENILPTQEQRFDKAEEQCEVLSNNDSLTPNRTDVITNQRQELHNQPCQTSPSPLISTSHINSEVCMFEVQDGESQNIVKVHTESKEIDSNKTLE